MVARHEYLHLSHQEKAASRSRAPSHPRHCSRIDIVDHTGGIQYGVARSSRPDQNAEALAAFVAPLGVEDFTDQAATAYGELRAELERRGTPIGSLDMLIAAHARSLDRTLITNNEREFRRVSGLRIENWV